jgi:Putative peptidoglycan binding domain
MATTGGKPPGPPPGTARRAAPIPCYFALLGLAMLSGLAAAPVQADTPRARGYLCCNLHAYKGWISDINYRHEGSRLLRAGTPIATLDAGRYSFGVRVAGQRFDLGNDYSRTLDATVFLRRYVTADDPRVQLAALDPQTRDAIEQLRVRAGMTPEQVRMAVGYPVASYTPHLNAGSWQYWLDRSSRFDVHFDANRRVRSVSGDRSVLARVVYEPPAAIVNQAQIRLRELGFDAGEPDGRLGPRPRGAIEQFQRRSSLSPTRSLDAATLAALASPVSTPTPPAAQPAPEPAAQPAAQPAPQPDVQPAGLPAAPPANAIEPAAERAPPPQQR